MYAGREDGPHALAPAAASLAPRSVGDLAVDGQETHPLFHGVIGRLNPGYMKKGKVVCSVVAKPLGDVLGFGPLRCVPCPVNHRLLGPFGREFPLLRGHLAATVPKTEEVLNLRQQLLAVATRCQIGEAGRLCAVSVACCRPARAGEA